MQQQLTIDEYRSLVGQEVGVSEWILVDQDKIQRFADLTEDWAFLHVDPEAARKAGLGGTVAHGFLTIALIATVARTGFPGLKGVSVGFNYGFNRLRLVAPVPSGARIRGRFRLKDCTERDNGEWLMIFDVTMEVEGQDRPALVAEWLIVNRVD